MSTNSRYWGGAKVNPATIRPLDAADFKQLVTRLFENPVGLPVSREEYAALDKDGQFAIKNAPYITGCSFKPGTTERNDFNADELVVQFIDLDDGEDVRRLHESPEILAELLHPYSFAAYYTASSTPENPRMRIAVDLVPCAPEHRFRIVRFIGARLGLPNDFKGYRESTVVSQPMFRPVAFRGDTTSPVFASRTDGLQLDIDDVPELPETEDTPGKCFTFAGDYGDDFGLAFLPVQGLTVEQIRPMIEVLDPDMGYEPWGHIISSLRHQFRTPEEAEAAFVLFEEWSSNGTKYKDGECYRKWRSFTPDPKGKAPRTIRTLIKMAIDAGWDSKPFVEETQKTLEEWFESCKDKAILMSEGCRRIVGLPFNSAVVEDHLVAQLRVALKGEGVAVDKTAIRKEISRLKQQKHADARGDDKPGWLRSVYYVGRVNVFHNVLTGEQLIPESFDNMFGKELISPDPESESAKTGRPAILPRHYALNQIQIERVHDTMYCPLKGSEADPIIDYKGRQYLNIYRPGSAPAMDAARSKEAAKLFKEHMRILIPDIDDRRHVIDYLCHQVQFPGEKIPWITFIHSAEGIGKGFLAKVMMGVLGKENVGVVGPQVLTNQWNDWQVGKIYVILDEVHIPGHQREAVMNSVKVAISDTTVPINKRNTHAFDAPNYTNYIAFSNFADALYLKPTDRRWHCVQSEIQTEEQVMELTESGHFIRMEPLLETLSGALRHWMMNRKISDTFPRHGPAPKTRFREAIIENSKNPMLVAIEGLIADPAEPLIGDDVIHVSHLEMMVGYLAKTGLKVSSYLRSLGYERWNHGEVRDVCGTRTEMYVHSRRFVEELGDPDEILEARAPENDL